MNRRMLLAFGAIALLAAGVILYLALHTDDSAAAGNRGQANDPATANTTNDPAAGSGKRVVTAANGSNVTVWPDGTREYVREDGVTIRDHRKHLAPSEPIPKREPPPDGRKIDKAITTDLNKVFQPVLRECAAMIPTEARGKKPRLDGVMTIAIKDHQATITDTTVGLRDVQDGAAGIAEFKKCLTEKSAGLAAQAPGESDVEKYQITLSLSLPKAPVKPKQ